MKNRHYLSAIPIALIALLSITVCARTQQVDSLINAVNTQNLPPAEWNIQSAIEYFNNGNYDTALVYCEKALALAQEIENEKMEARALELVANIYLIQNKLKESLQYFMKALSVFEKLADKNKCARILVTIGAIHTDLKNNDRAIYYLDKAMIMAEELNDSTQICLTYFSLGAIYLDKEEYDKALEYELKVIDISRSIGLNGYMLEVSAMNILAKIYFQGLNDYDKAEAYAQEALRLAEERDILIAVVESKSTLASVYLKQKRYNECDAIASMAYSMISVEPELAKNIIPNIVMANIFLGNKDKAADFFQKYEDFVKQYNNESLHRSLSEMEVKYETEKKEVQITTLKKEKTLYIGLGIVGTALFLALSLLFIIRHRFDINKRKLAEQQTALAEQQIKHLEQEQQMIATQSVIDGEIAERTRLARDLHDGLGGMLSILKLHLDDVADAREMLDQSINELHRVAHHLMPQSLLRDGLKTALDDFCKAIPNAQFHYFGDNHRLDDKFELLIYRCAYELLNNAFKYANASNINIQLVKNTDYVSLTVEDNGCGFDPEKITSGMGLESLRARVAVYNGKIDIFSAPGKGTEVFVELKIEN